METYILIFIGGIIVGVLITLVGIEKPKVKNNCIDCEVRERQDRERHSEKFKIE